MPVETLSNIVPPDPRGRREDASAEEQLLHQPRHFRSRERRLPPLLLDGGHLHSARRGEQETEMDRDQGAGRGPCRHVRQLDVTSTHVLDLHPAFADGRGGGLRGWGQVGRREDTVVERGRANGE